MEKDDVSIEGKYRLYWMFVFYNLKAIKERVYED